MNQNDVFTFSARRGKSQILGSYWEAFWEALGPIGGPWADFWWKKGQKQKQGKISLVKSTQVLKRGTRERP